MSFYRVKTLYQRSKFIRLFFNIINGFEKPKNMSILKSGRIFPFVLEGQENIEPEWLSSCLMYHKDVIDKQSITSPENQTEGKAYYEDVFFTLSLRKKGFKLIKDEDITMTHPYKNSIKPREYINTIYRQKKLLEITGGSYLLFYLDVFASFCFYSILHIKSKLNKRR
jgi:GT2 family glycosyltransferase